MFATHASYIMTTFINILTFLLVSNTASAKIGVLL